MLTDEQAIPLHHRAALGQPLTAEERAQLAAWYAQKDEEEAEMLKLNQGNEEAELEEIKRQLNLSLKQLVLEVERRLQIDRDNERLLIEIKKLQQQVSERLLPKPTQKPVVFPSSTS